MPCFPHPSHCQHWPGEWHRDLEDVVSPGAPLMGMHVCVAGAAGQPWPVVGRKRAGMFSSMVPPVCGLFLSPQKT